MIRIYTSKQCEFCKELKEKLKIAELKYTEIDVDDPKNKKEVDSVFKKAGEPVIPIIVFPPNMLVPKKSFQTIDNAIGLIQTMILS